MNLDLIKALYGDIGPNAKTTVEFKENDFANYLIIKDKNKLDVKSLDKTNYSLKGKHRYGIIVSSSESAIRIQTIWRENYKRFNKPKAKNRAEFETNRKIWQNLDWHVRYKIELDYLVKRKKDGELKVIAVSPPSSRFSKFTGYATITGSNRWSSSLDKALGYALFPLENYIHKYTMKFNTGLEHFSIDTNGVKTKVAGKPVYEKLIAETFIFSNLARLKYVPPRRKKKATSKKKRTK